MKRVLLIITLFLLTGSVLRAQDDENNDKIRDKMTEFIQRRMNLSKDEAEKFSPVFLRYFKEWRSALREFRGRPQLDLQQRIVELRLRYRNEFKDIVGEKRSNEVFEQQERFIEGVRKMRDDQQRLQGRENRPNKRFRSMMQ
ncbi:MAG: hypothetical protein ACHQEB_03235 [Chitinophagales bacterium]